MSVIKDPLKIEYVEIKEEEITPCEFKTEETDKQLQIKEESTVNLQNTVELKCSVCNKNFTQKLALIIHERLHNLINIFKCNVCDQTFIDVQLLITHKRIHTEVTCTECNETFVNKLTYKKHKKIHDENKYKCPQCDKTFRDPWYVSSHLSRIHAFKRPNQCAKCHKVFKLLSDLKRHETIHTGEQASKCLICNKVFIDLKSLNKHKVDIHPDIVCHLCHQIFYDSTELDLHRCDQMNETNFRCIPCNRTFTEEADLADHRATSHVPTYKCDACEKTFNYLIHLKHHQKIHLPRKYESNRCHICNKNFRILRNHMIVHTNERPHQCTICDRSFTRSVYLTNHEKTHAKELPFQCNVCNRRFPSNRILQEHKKRSWNCVTKIQSMALLKNNRLEVRKETCD